MKNILKKEILIILCVILTPMIHELGHFIIYSIEGVPANIHYGLTISEKNTFWGVCGGILIEIIIAILCIILIYINKKNEMLWGTIGFIASINRIICICGIFLAGLLLDLEIWKQNDEGKIANFLGVHYAWIYLLSITIFFILILFIIKLLKKDKIEYKKIFLRITLYTIVVTIYSAFSTM